MMKQLMRAFCVACFFVRLPSLPGWTDGDELPHYYMLLNFAELAAAAWLPLLLRCAALGCGELLCTETGLRCLLRLGSASHEGFVDSFYPPDQGFTVWMTVHPLFTREDSCLQSDSSATCGMPPLGFDDARLCSHALRVVFM